MTENPKAKRERKERSKVLALPKPLALSEQESRELAEYAHSRLGTVLAEHEAQESLQAARRLFRYEPAIYTLCYQDLLSGQAPYVVCDRYKAEYEAVAQIRRIYPEVVLAGRRQIVHNLEQVSLNLSNRLATEGSMIAIDKVAGTLATVIEKLQLLTGGVTSRSEHVGAPKPEELKAMFDQLPSAKAEVIEGRNST